MQCVPYPQSPDSRAVHKVAIPYPATILLLAPEGTVRCGWTHCHGRPLAGCRLDEHGVAQLQSDEGSGQRMKKCLRTPNATKRKATDTAAFGAKEKVCCSVVSPLLEIVLQCSEIGGGTTRRSVSSSCPGRATSPTSAPVSAGPSDPTAGERNRSSTRGHRVE